MEADACEEQREQAERHEQTCERALRAELDSFWTRELDQLVRDAGDPI